MKGEIIMSDLPTYRVMPSPHPYAVCAPEGKAIKEYYEGYFDTVYIFYHPFIKAVSIEMERFNPDAYPGKFELMANCKMVSWEEIIGLAGLVDYRELDVGLRTRISGLGKRYSNEEIVPIIEQACERENIAPPDEGFLSKLLINQLLEALKGEGHDWVWVGDEHGSERKLTYIDDLIISDTLQRHNLFTHNHDLLITTHWDSHFSMLCGNKETVERIVQRCGLEGFYCDEKTEIYWSVR